MVRASMVGLMIPETTKEALLEAMERFDREARDNSEWKGWEAKQSHKYAIEYEGRRYPVKKIVSLATNTPVGSFSGGDEANGVVEKLGLHVSKLHEAEQGEASIQQQLQGILENYSAARAGGGFGGTHPIWQSFTKLKKSLEDLPALREQRTLRIEWSIGKGNWARVPWIAIIDSRETEAPRRGVYCVFLFRQDMSGVYATLNQGVTKPKQELGAIEARQLLRKQAEHIRILVPELKGRGFYLDDRIDLRAQGLGAEYEESTIAYKLYEKDRVPSDSEIGEDVEALLEAYTKALQDRESTTGPQLPRSSTWIFQANPKLFDLFGALKELKEMTWLVNQYESQIHSRDLVYLWESGPEGGIVAVANVKSEPARSVQDDESEKFNRSAENFDGERLRAWLTIEKVLPERISRADLLGHPSLRSLSILMNPRGTNFPVTAEQEVALRMLIEGGEPDRAFDHVSAIQELIQAVESAGFVYEPWQIASYVAALRTKPFVILAGVSGTGKSKLPAIVAQLTGGQAELIPVRPDWTDSAEVLGYVDLQGTFRPGRLIQIARQASIQSNRHWTCIIDEMNLARVEQYFAEILSRLEDRYASPNGGFSSRPVLALKLRSEDEFWSEITLPGNLALVGTVNMDETTHGFSRKVLDRAFTIELSDVDLTRWTAATEMPAINAWPSRAWYPRAISLSGLSGLKAGEMAIVQSVIGTLTVVNGFLQQAQLQVGYRTRDEVALFALHAAEISNAFVGRDGSTVDPLDLALHMKILPRLVGGSSAVRHAVMQLLGWARSGKPFASEEDCRSVLEEWIDLGRPATLLDSHYPKTAARLCIMWERFLTEGYTSYWL
jgi:MrcB-like, N-terminal domain/EVE domain/AAA domain (dynein-related subfamily)